MKIGQIKKEFLPLQRCYLKRCKPKQTRVVRSFLYRYPSFSSLSLIICNPTDKFQIFSCFTGLAYIDVKNLWGNNIRTSFDGNLWIMGKRGKTGVNFNIPLLEISTKILDKYKGKLPDDRILPVPSNQKMNAYLKEIGAICGIDKDLTFHLARFSFATTVCLTQGVPIETLSQMMGYLSIKTTQIYAEVTRTKINEDMTNLVETIQGKYELPENDVFCYSIDTTQKLRQLR